MKRIATSVVTVALACLGMVVDAKGATNNDRSYVAQISPSATTPLITQPYHLTVTNDLRSGPSHFIRQIIVTVPAAFPLVNIPGTTSPVTPPPLWKVQSITGSPGTAHVITLVTISSSDASMTSGKSATVVINATSPASSGTCGPGGSASYTWNLAVN